MDINEDVSTEEILASIRSILLEKQEALSKEEIFELTRDMVYKTASRAGFDRVTDEMINDVALLFEQEARKNEKSVVRVRAKTDL